jgi:hypothetical protein
VGEWIAAWPAGCRGLGIDEDTAVVEGDGGWTVRGRGRAITMSSFGQQEVHPAGSRLESIQVRV